jgi:hypothetical protein
MSLGALRLGFEDGGKSANLFFERLQGRGKFGLFLQLTRRRSARRRRPRPAAGRAGDLFDLALAAGSAVSRQSRALARPFGACASRARSRTCAVDMLSPKNSVATSGNWCASSKITVFAGRQQFGHALVAQHHVGEEEVMIDHHQIGRHRLACAPAMTKHSL